ncbi:acyltransferase [Candidatus Woesearchaeota archaeon]|jgi:acetyltransferase-like isoleucine patch superfamily enzyme|nr:acyltransferase [Candidatus Woesearchaeota archaeon]
MNKGSDVIIADDVYIKHSGLVTLGNRVAIDKGFYCTTRVEIGDYVHISPYVTCIGNPKGLFVAKGFNNIMAGSRIVCGSNKFDGSGLHGALIPEELRGNEIFGPVIMEPFSNIGTNSVVLCGARLRMGVLLAVGSVLMGDTEEWGVYKGNPAKLVKKIDGSKIIDRARVLGYEF